MTGRLRTLGVMRSVDFGVRLWAAAGLALLLGSGSAAGSSMFLPFFAVVSWLAWGVQVWALRLLRVRGGEGGPARSLARDLLGPPLFVLALWLVSGVAGRASATGWAHVELWRHRPEYLALVARLADGATAPESKLRPRVDDGEPLRVAFPWGTGLVDNWRAIVHDPTGLVLRAGTDDPDAARARDLFGGHLVHCVHLSGPFYFCVFT